MSVCGLSEKPHRCQFSRQILEWDMCALRTNGMFVGMFECALHTQIGAMQETLKWLKCQKPKLLRTKCTNKIPWKAVGGVAHSL